LAPGRSAPPGFPKVEWFWIASYFFQADDGIRVRTVTGVQTCALPIYQLVYQRPLLLLFVHLVIHLFLRDIIFLSLISHSLDNNLHDYLHRFFELYKV